MLHGLRVTSPASASPLYAFERFDVGVVLLDDERRVISMNDFARRVLPVDTKQPFDQFVLSFHPERSQPKVEFMLDQAAQCPVANPPPMTMMISIPDRILLIKVTRVSNGDGHPTGYALVFYDITETVSQQKSPGAPAETRRRLTKLPTIADNTVVFVDADEVQWIYSHGHYSRVRTSTTTRFCNLSIGDIEARLDPDEFLRVHRGHIVRLRSVLRLERAGARTQLVLDGVDTPVPVSRERVAALRERLGLASV